MSDDEKDVVEEPAQRDLEGDPTGQSTFDVDDSPEPPAETELVDGETVEIGHDDEFITVQLVAMRNDGSREVIKGTTVPGTYGLAALPSTFVPTEEDDV
jgi:hypothetical protein